ncbi:energy transducer TonB [Rufibacter roseus]|uniref:Energy transducer TonB n=1 Tax=Rufibacter roseus TaxID=1567108 RepID=A0ABW2DII0_9BACT|nr:hypothetical protein [Rufibacter roseus]
MKFLYSIAPTFLLFLLCFTPLLTVAQTKKVKAKGPSRYIQIESSVLKSDPSIKDGPSRTLMSGRVVEKGNFENNKKVGVWTYLDSSPNQYLEFDHTLNKVIDDTRKKSAEQLRKITNAPADSTVSLEPVFLGSWGIVYRQLTDKFRVTAEAVRASVDGTIVVAIKIGDDGKPAAYEVVEKMGYGMDEELLRVLIPILEDSEWHLPELDTQQEPNKTFLFPFKIRMR